MNGSGDHSVKCTDATMEILTPNSSGDGYANIGPLTLNYVRGRGNSTWQCNKKPYKLETNGVQNLFDMGESEDWALLANSYDKTLMRNRITSWLGEQMSGEAGGLEFNP